MVHIFGNKTFDFFGHASMLFMVHIFFNWSLLHDEVRMVTRSVEGLHSHIARVLRRAPASKLPYLSFELRASQLLELASYDPVEP